MNDSEISKLKIFISWHGAQSRVIAEAISNWLPCVIQNTDPFFSRNIEKGTQGLNEVGGRLEESNFGIICLTPENLDSKWIHFESGALAKLREKSHVYTLLYKLKHADVVAPLSQFQHTLLDKDDIFRLVESINSLAFSGADPSRLRTIFEKWWPDLEIILENIPAASTPVRAESDTTAAATSRTERDLIEEILENVRRLSDGDGEKASSAISNISLNKNVATSLGDMITAEQLRLMRTLAKKKGFNLENVVQLAFKCDLDQLSKEAADQAIRGWKL